MNYENEMAIVCLFFNIGNTVRNCFVGGNGATYFVVAVASLSACRLAAAMVRHHYKAMDCRRKQHDGKVYFQWHGLTTVDTKKFYGGKSIRFQGLFFLVYF